MQAHVIEGFEVRFEAGRASFTTACKHVEHAAKRLAALIRSV